MSLLKQAIAAGWSIRHASSLSNQQLEDLHRTEMESATPMNLPSASTDDPVSNSPQVARLRDACKRAILDLDSKELDSVLRRAELELNERALLDELVEPLMIEIGALWQKGDLRIMHEHLATASFRSLLERVSSSFNPSLQAPRLLIATPEGQLHELGAVSVNIAASSEGWQTLYLGANLPANEIAAAAIHSKARAIALSASYIVDASALINSLRTLRSLLPQEFLIMIGGPGATHLRSHLEDFGLEVVSDLRELRTILRETRETPDLL